MTVAVAIAREAIARARRTSNDAAPAAAAAVSDGGAAVANEAPKLDLERQREGRG